MSHDADRADHKFSEAEIRAAGRPIELAGSDIGVVLSHGFTATPQTMRFLAEYLHEKEGWTILAPVLAGHGTTPQDMARSTGRQWHDSVEDAVDALGRRCRRVFLAGHSIGGAIALVLAARRPQALAGVAAINAAVGAEIADSIGPIFERGLPEFLPGLGADLKDRSAQEPAYPQFPVAAGVQAAFLMLAAQQLLPRIKIPTLVVSSRVDHVVPPASSAMIFERAGTEDKQIVHLDNSFHVSPLDFDKAIAAEALRAFFKARV